jgi:hemerythrin-like domain-containing protein
MLQEEVEMRPTEILINEHRVIEKMLGVIEKVSERLERGEEVPAEHLEKIVEFIRTFADKCHHGKEEGVLFPALEEAGVPREGGPIGVMLYEHEEGRRFVQGMSDAIDQYKKGTDGAEFFFLQNAKNYVGLLRDHIQKEDNILFQIANFHLSQEREKEILKEFEKVEEEKVGRGVHEEMHKLVEELEGIYQ